MNYTVRYGDNYDNATSLARGYTKDNGIALFDLMPKCYLEIFEEHISTDMIDHDDNIQDKAAHWMMERESSDTDCLNRESALSRFALAVLNFAAPISPSITSESESRLWIEQDSPDLCNWENIVCAKNSNATQMDFIHLDLSGLGISGYLTTELGLLSTLARYDVSHNTLTGLIPSEIGELTTLSVLKLNSNNLTGSIPKEIGLLTSINEIFIESNHWTGSIPIEIGFLSDLVDLNVGNNTLNGNIPSEIGLMTSLTFLNVDTNDLTGTIPSEIGLLTNLVILNLNNNGLTGPIPSEIGLLTALERLRIGNNFLTGFMPSEIRSLTSLTILDIDSISSEMEGLSALEELPYIVDFP
jgi:Leucine-rich repeat (LRR) protein